MARSEFSQQSELSSFCDGLGNESKGIVIPEQRRKKQGEKKQKGENIQA